MVGSVSGSGVAASPYQPGQTQFLPVIDCCSMRDPLLCDVGWGVGAGVERGGFWEAGCGAGYTLLNYSSQSSKASLLAASS